MEEAGQSQVQSIEQPAETQEPTNVGFPQPIQRKKGGFGKLLIIFLGLAILGVIGFLVFKGISNSSPTPSATPSVEGVTSPGSSSEPTPTPSVTDKSTVSIKIMNGTGIAGEAGYLQDVLKNLGYSKIEVGNADSQDNTKTSVTFSSLLSQDVIDEITKKLESIYQSVQTKTSSSPASDVTITTGLRKGATPKPAATEAPAATETPSPSPSSSPAA